MHVPDGTLLQPRLQRAQPVAVGVPGGQDPSHGAFHGGQIIQKCGRVVLQLLQLLTDVREIYSWGVKGKHVSHKSRPGFIPVPETDPGEKLSDID